MVWPMVDLTNPNAGAYADCVAGLFGSHKKSFAPLWLEACWVGLDGLASHIVDCGENESESEKSKGWNEFPTEPFH